MFYLSYKSQKTTKFSQWETYGQKIKDLYCFLLITISNIAAQPTTVNHNVRLLGFGLVGCAWSLLNTPLLRTIKSEWNIILVLRTHSCILFSTHGTEFQQSLPKTRGSFKVCYEHRGKMNHGKILRSGTKYYE